MAFNSNFTTELLRCDLVSKWVIHNESCEQLPGFEWLSLYVELHSSPAQEYWAVIKRKLQSFPYLSKNIKEKPCLISQKQTFDDLFFYTSVLPWSPCSTANCLKPLLVSGHALAAFDFLLIFGPSLPVPHICVRGWGGETLGRPSQNALPWGWAWRQGWKHWRLNQPHPGQNPLDCFSPVALLPCVFSPLSWIALGLWRYTLSFSTT